MTAGNKRSNHEPLVRLVDVHKRFGDLIVLDGIDLTLRTGETTVVIGESGVGKSVILKHIVRLLRPDSGEVHYRDQRIDRLPERKLAALRPRFGFLFQLNALFDSMNVEDNVAFPIREHTRRSRGEIRETVREKLAMVGLDGLQRQWPAELSGGQKKRVALARAIALDPELILYDEPTTGLDPPRADEINELILKLQRGLSVTSVVVTHDMASARKVADRIIMLYQGKFIFDGTPDSIMQTDDARVRCFVDGRCQPEILESLHEKGST
ncbi:MAG: ABC transporter ATP-binding protein [Planctomycetota bacterium]|jgi:phospholipid/cholesterol/gamma-HCH transport system ATP-binding protein